MAIHHFLAFFFLVIATIINHLKSLFNFECWIIGDIPNLFCTVLQGIAKGNFMKKNQW